MTTPAGITGAAREYLAGRPVVLRSSPRHGCCGGTALVPVVEIGPPADPNGFDLSLLDGVEVYVDRRLDDAQWWTIDLDRILRWKRLVVSEVGVDVESDTTTGDQSADAASPST